MGSRSHLINIRTASILLASTYPCLPARRRRYIYIYIDISIYER